MKQIRVVSSMKPDTEVTMMTAAELKSATQELIEILQEARKLLDPEKSKRS